MDKIKQKAERLPKPVQWDIPEYIQLPLRPLAFERALMNIITNACKYAENVWVKAELGEGERVFIIVEDDGPVIDEGKFKEVFKPFYRLDEARSADTGGVGLGMPIAMDIIHSHGGKIWLAKSDKGGLKVVIRLPM
jgi:two-component system osmolarity sensor histidine kinase EnvZ